LLKFLKILTIHLQILSFLTYNKVIAYCKRSDFTLQNNLYREFYQKSLMPAGLSDKQAFLDIQNDMLHTHLLIGLQGHQKGDSEYFNWNVTIYKSDSSGIYDAGKPVYASTLFDRFDDAVEAARNIEKEILSDQLHTMRKQEKIS
jgi:hypothetical protein